MVSTIHMCNHSAYKYMYISIKQETLVNLSGNITVFILRKWYKWVQIHIKITSNYHNKILSKSMISYDILLDYQQHYMKQ